MMTWYCKIVSLAAVGLLAAACSDANLPPDGDEANLSPDGDEANLPPAADEANVQPPAAENVSQVELRLDGECNRNSDCNIGQICVNVAFGPNYCAALCGFDALGEHNCPPGFDCTRPFFANRWRCTPD